MDAQPAALVELPKWPVDSLVISYFKTIYLFMAGRSVYSGFAIMWKSKY
jgi:hypothetical protein